MSYLIIDLALFCQRDLQLIIYGKTNDPVKVNHPYFLGHYGSFLQDDPELIVQIVSTAVSRLKVPVSCKIRVLPDAEETVKYAQKVEEAGAAVSYHICIHVGESAQQLIHSTLLVIMPLGGVNSVWPRDAIWRHRSGSTLTQVMACCLMAPSHYLNQCWLTISKVPLAFTWGY